MQTNRIHLQVRATAPTSYPSRALHRKVTIVDAPPRAIGADVRAKGNQLLGLLIKHVEMQ